MSVHRHFIQNLLVRYTYCEYTTRIDLVCVQHILTVQLFVVLFLFSLLYVLMRGVVLLTKITGGTGCMSIKHS